MSLHYVIKQHNTACRLLYQGRCSVISVYETEKHGAVYSFLEIHNNPKWISIKVKYANDVSAFFFIAAAMQWCVIVVLKEITPVHQYMIHISVLLSNPDSHFQKSCLVLWMLTVNGYQYTTWLGVQLPHSVSLCSWYHYDLSRHAAEALLLSNGVDGNFLLRNSNKGPDCFALSVR